MPRKNSKNVQTTETVVAPVVAPAVETKPETVKTAPTNAHGRRTNNAAHFVSIALFEAGDAGIGVRDLAIAAGRLALAANVPARAGISPQLVDMRNEMLVEVGGLGYKLTDYGRKLWTAGVPTTRAQLREAADAVRAAEAARVAEEAKKAAAAAAKNSRNSRKRK